MIKITIDKDILKLTKHLKCNRYLSVKSSWECQLVGKKRATRFDTKAVAEYVSERFWELCRRDSSAHGAAFGYMEKIPQLGFWTRQVVEIKTRPSTQTKKGSSS